MTPSRCVLLGLAGLASLLYADDAPVVFRSDVSLVRVDVQVLDRDNHAVTGLRAEDFELRDDGKPREIRNFLSEEMPVDVLFLMDVSASMRPHVQRIASASGDALRVLGNDDQVAIMVFDRSTRVRMPFRSKNDGVQREFDRLLRDESFRGGTDITRGLLDAANYIRQHGRRNARRAIVILTDDQTEMERDDQRVSRALVDADAVLSALIAPDAMQNRQYGGMGQGGGYPRGGGGYPGGGRRGGVGMGGPLGGIIFGSPGGGRGGNYPGGGYPGGGGGGYPRGGGQVGPHTHSAGTSEIARDSGGDSLPVDDASALETTLSRLRQRYALHFLAPEGAKPGESRNIQVLLAANVRSRYPDADVRYRRGYRTPETSVAASSAPSAPGGGEPAVVSNSPTLRRRPAVDESSSGPRTANSSDSTSTPAPAAAEAPAPSKGGWRRVDEPEPPPATIDPKDQGTFRKARPEDQ